MKHEPFLLIDCHHGIYIPKMFMESLKTGNYKLKDVDENLLQCLKELDSPDNELYWEAWDEVERNGVFVDREGNEYTLYQNGDLWLIPEKWYDETTEEERNLFFGN